MADARVNNQDPSPRSVLPPVYFLLALSGMTCFHVFLPVHRILSGPWRYLGLIPLPLAMALVLWAARLFGRAGTAIRPFERSSILVLDGPFRLTRNPMYVGMTGILVGVGILLGSLLPFFVIPVFILVIDRRFVQHEEAILEDTFGQEYSAYRSRVRRWL